MEYRGVERGSVVGEKREGWGGEGEGFEGGSVFGVREVGGRMGRKNDYKMRKNNFM